MTSPVDALAFHRHNMPTAVTTAPAGPLSNYAPPPGVFDEVFAAPQTVRPHWKRFLDVFQRVPADAFAQRSAQADRLLIENGVTYNVFGDGKESQRPWRLDLLPVVVSPEDWGRLERALEQRARLLDLVIRDLYGSQRLIRQRHLPPEIIYGHPGFIRPFHALRPETEPALLLYSAELARAPDGQWWVMSDRAEAPPGAGYALENRIVSSRTISQLMHRVGVQRLAPFFIRLQNALKKRASRPAENPRIVLLTSGTRHPHYFEDVYLARYLGLTLVEGGDLATRDDRVFVKTLGGLVPVDVIFSRGSEGGVDPLELGGGSPHGVPGLLQAIRKGHVQVANTPGCALIESPVFMAFLPALCRHLLGETLAAPSIATWWCGQPEHCRYVLEHLDQLVLKPAFERSGSDEFLPELLSREAVADLRSSIAARPYDFVAQEKVARSAAPVWHNGTVRCGHVAVRTYLVSDETGFSLMPGGLIRIAPTIEPMELSITAGDGSKDLWVLADGPVEPVTLLVSEDQPVPLRRTGAMFPSRVADDLFWLGQSLDRADFLCRLLRSVVERLTAESEEDQPELPVLVRALAYQGQIEPGFAVDDFSGQLPALEESLPRAVFDSMEPRGITQAVSEMLRLASEARDWLSPDTWRTIHQVATDFLFGNTQRRSDLADVLATLNQVLVDLASVSGLIQDGMIRGPAWRFLDMGRRIERGRDTIGIVRSTLMTGQVPDKAVLRALVEVLDCRMTYRSRYLDNIQQNAVLDLAVTDETNPHSVAFQALSIADHVDALPQDLLTPLRTEEKRAAMAAVHAVRMLTPHQLAESPPASVEAVLGTLEQQFRTLAETLTRKYLLHSGIPRQITDEEAAPA